jgi:hypothetical protein
MKIFAMLRLFGKLDEYCKTKKPTDRKHILLDAFQRTGTEAWINVYSTHANHEGNLNYRQLLKNLGYSGEFP